MHDYQESPHYRAGSSGKVEVFPAPETIVRDYDVKVPMRDGVSLAANVFRPAQQGRYPVIISTSPYGKDEVDAGLRNRDIPNFHTGVYAASDTAAWEAPDPAYWVPHGYVVIHCDTRGQWKSEGVSAPLMTSIVAEDYYDLIEWAGIQSWSDRNVGLCGVSYLAVSQWMVAPLQPPHLKAIMPWEGWINNYDFLYFGGIPERGFTNQLETGWIGRMRNPNSEVDPADTPSERLRHSLRDEYWSAQDNALENIHVPAFVCGSFSDQGLHTPDSFHGYRRLGSAEKWLYTHRRLKWEVFYGEQDLQRRFFDCFLKHVENGMRETPRVHLEVYENRETFKTLAAGNWPVEGTQYFPFHLDVERKALRSTAVAQPVETTYRADGSERVTFDLDFKADTDIVGHAKLKLWVSADEADDIDLFVGLQKLDANGDQVFFYGQTGSNANDLVARGWLRVSHRELDQKRSTEWLPVHTHRREQKLTPGEIVSVEIEILPSATTFRAGERLRLVIQGATILPGAPWIDFDTSNCGATRVHAGGQFDSYLLLPILTHPGG